MAELVVDLRPAGKTFGRLGVEADRFIEVGQGPVGIALSGIDRRPAAIGLGLLQSGLDRLLVIGEGLIQRALPPQEFRAVGDGARRSPAGPAARR